MKASEIVDNLEWDLDEAKITIEYLQDLLHDIDDYFGENDLEHLLLAQRVKRAIK